MKWINLVTRKVADKKETEFCIPLHSYEQMVEYTPTDADMEELERLMKH